ncbi:hypothetical protein ACWGI0_01785 [Streptomyces sp. NPDC054802]
MTVAPGTTTRFAPCPLTADDGLGRWLGNRRRLARHSASPPPLIPATLTVPHRRSAAARLNR